MYRLRNKCFQVECVLSSAFVLFLINAPFIVCKQTDPISMVFESMVPKGERDKSPDKMNTIYGDALLRYGYSKISFTKHE